MAELRVANAPCSFGAFELSVGMPDVPDPIELLDTVAGAGYDGVDLGPVGYLGDPAQLQGRLRERGLDLTGGFLELPLGAGADFDSLRAEVDRMLDLFERAGGDPAPKPTLADAGSPERFAAPGRAQLDPGLGLDEAGWGRFAETLAKVVERCRERGFDPTFHPHAGTYVEAGWEIERLLELSDVGLCFDSGHLMVGGIEPLTALREWGPRINHLHLKDVDRDGLEAALAAQSSLEELFGRRVFCALGKGDIRLSELCEELRTSEREGWLVVEQDALPTHGFLAQAERDQVANREYLREHGL